MDYRKVYDAIITRSKSRALTGYTETHHIIPKCLGGSNKKENLTILTAREHFICHWLLSRMYPGNRKLAYAFFAMCKQQNSLQERYIPSSRAYEEARSNYSRLGLTEEHKQKISKSQLKNTNNSSRVFKGMKSNMSEQGRQKLAEARKRDQTGKVGDQAKASKGWVICEYEDGSKIEAANALHLSYTLKISPATISDRLNNFPDTFKKGYKIYYKNSN